MKRGGSPQRQRHPEAPARFARASKDGYESCVATLRGSLRSHLRVTAIFWSEPYLPEIDARPELHLHGRPPATRVDLDRIGARTLVELVELEIPVVVAGRLGDQRAVAQQPYARAFHAIDEAIRLRRERAADEAFRIAPEVAVVDPRLAGELGLHHFEALSARHPR